MSRWWRAYDEAVDDPKLQRLGPALGWAWFNLMCIASKHSGVLPAIGDVAFKLRVSEQKAAATITALVAAGLFERNADGVFAPHNWEGRQFQSDASNGRVKRFRERQRNVTPTVTVTAPETEQRQSTEAETDISSLRSENARESDEPAKPKRAKAKSALPEDWKLDEQDVDYATGRGFSHLMIPILANAFANHHRSKGNLMADWHAAWRTWVDNEIKFNGGPNGQRSRAPARRPAGADFLEGMRSVAEDLLGDTDPSRRAASEVPLGRFNIDG